MKSEEEKKESNSAVLPEETAVVNLTDRAQAYYNEVSYSLDYGDGKVVTESQVLDHCFCELAAFEERMGESVTSFLQSIKEAEQISETPEKAKAYLQSNGIDTEELATRGIEFIKQVKVNVEQKKLIAYKDAEIKALQEKPDDQDDIIMLFCKYIEEYTNVRLKNWLAGFKEWQLKHREVGNE